VRTGAGSYTSMLANSANNEIISLPKSNVSIFCEGGNDVGKNKSTKALQPIMNFIKTDNHTNIILANVHPGYDLM